MFYLVTHFLEMIMFESNKNETSTFVYDGEVNFTLGESNIQFMINVIDLNTLRPIELDSDIF